MVKTYGTDTKAKSHRDGLIMRRTARNDLHAIPIRAKMCDGAPPVIHLVPFNTCAIITRAPHPIRPSLRDFVNYARQIPTIRSSRWDLISVNQYGRPDGTSSQGSQYPIGKSIRIWTYSLMSDTKHRGIITRTRSTVSHGTLSLESAQQENQFAREVFFKPINNDRVIQVP
jgi:hypothetical protein